MQYKTHSNSSPQNSLHALSLFIRTKWTRYSALLTPHAVFHQSISAMFSSNKISQFLHTGKTDHISYAQYSNYIVHCSHPQHNSLPMHINMHYTPTTTYHTTFHNPPLHTTDKHKALLCKWWQNGTRCRDGVEVLWCCSHLVWLVFEGSIPTCACFHLENFLRLSKIVTIWDVKQNFTDWKKRLYTVFT